MALLVSTGVEPLLQPVLLGHIMCPAAYGSPPGLTSLPATQTLSAEQSTEIFNLAVECQALSTELAKQFQTLSGLEVMHCAAAQATAQETINAGQMAQNAAYSVLPDGQTWDKKHEETLQQLHAKADKAWMDN